MEVSLDPGHRRLWFPILGYEESSAQLALTRSTMPCLPPSQLQDLELTKEEYKGEQAGAECWPHSVRPQQLVLGLDQRLASDHQSGG